MKPTLIIVTGVPRSGTSMMMRVLEMGGIKCAYSSPERRGMRNIYGFYEGGAIPSEGNVAIKRFGWKNMMDSLASKYDCYFIVMRRNPQAIINSWGAVSPDWKVNNTIKLNNMVMTPDTVAENQKKNFDAVSPHKNILIKYDEMFSDTIKQLQRIKDFIPLPFDVEKAVGAVDKTLYINRNMV